MQPTEVNPGVVDVYHVDVKFVDGARAHVRSWVEGMSGPTIILLLQMKSPHVFLSVKVEGQQAVEAGRRQKNRVLHSADFMTVFEVSVPNRILDFELAVVAKKLIAGGDVDVVTVKRYATQTPVCASALEIDFAGVPVDKLYAFLILEVHGKYATVALALLAAAYDRSRD